MSEVYKDKDLVKKLQANEQQTLDRLREQFYAEYALIDPLSANASLERTVDWERKRFAYVEQKRQKLQYGFHDRPGEKEPADNISHNHDDHDE